MDYYIGALKKYADFSGRARRKEFWMFSLISILMTIIISIVGTITHLFFLTFIYSLAVFIPALAVGVRRLHDINRSGWWFFIGLIPLVGPIIILVFHVTDSQPGENKYGPNPKEMSTVSPTITS